MESDSQLAGLEHLRNVASGLETTVKKTESRSLGSPEETRFNNFPPSDAQAQIQEFLSNGRRGADELLIEQMDYSSEFDSTTMSCDGFANTAALMAARLRGYHARRLDRALSAKRSKSPFNNKFQFDDLALSGGTSFRSRTPTKDLSGGLLDEEFLSPIRSSKQKEVLSFRSEADDQDDNFLFKPPGTNVPELQRQVLALQKKVRHLKTNVSSPVGPRRREGLNEGGSLPDDSDGAHISALKREMAELRAEVSNSGPVPGSPKWKTQSGGPYGSAQSGGPYGSAGGSFGSPQPTLEEMQMIQALTSQVQELRGAIVGRGLQMQPPPPLDLSHLAPHEAAMQGLAHQVSSLRQQISSSRARMGPNGTPMQSPMQLPSSPSQGIPRRINSKDDDAEEQQIRSLMDEVREARLACSVLSQQVQDSEHRLGSSPVGSVAMAPAAADAGATLMPNGYVPMNQSNGQPHGWGVSEAGAMRGPYEGHQGYMHPEPIPEATPWTGPARGGSILS